MEVFILIIFLGVGLFLLSLKHAHKRDMYGHNKNQRHKDKNHHRIFKSDGTSRVTKIGKYLSYLILLTSLAHHTLSLLT